jgi:hypothetical protein
VCRQDTTHDAWGCYATQAELHQENSFIQLEQATEVARIARQNPEQRAKEQEGRRTADDLRRDEGDGYSEEEAQLDRVKAYWIEHRAWAAGSSQYPKPRSPPPIGRVGRGPCFAVGGGYPTARPRGGGREQAGVSKEHQPTEQQVMEHEWAIWDKAWEQEQDPRHRLAHPPGRFRKAQGLPPPGLPPRPAGPVCDPEVYEVETKGDATRYGSGAAGPSTSGGSPQRGRGLVLGKAGLNARQGAYSGEDEGRRVRNRSDSGSGGGSPPRGRATEAILPSNQLTSPRLHRVWQPPPGQNFWARSTEIAEMGEGFAAALGTMKRGFEMGGELLTQSEGKGPSPGFNEVLNGASRRARDQSKDAFKVYTTASAEAVGMLLRTLLVHFVEWVLAALLDLALPMYKLSMRMGGTKMVQAFQKSTLSLEHGAATLADSVEGMIHEVMEKEMVRKQATAQHLTMANSLASAMTGSSRGGQQPRMPSHAPPPPGPIGPIWPSGHVQGPRAGPSRPPGQPPVATDQCKQWMRNGTCSYGPECKWATSHTPR